MEYQEPCKTFMLGWRLRFQFCSIDFELSWGGRNVGGAKQRGSWRCEQADDLSSKQTLKLWRPTDLQTKERLAVLQQVCWAQWCAEREKPSTSLTHSLILKMWKLQITHSHHQRHCTSYCTVCFNLQFEWVHTHCERSQLRLIMR